MALAAIVAGCASSPPIYNPGRVAMADMDRITAACSQVVRLPNGSYYDLHVCEESLSRSLAGRIKAVELGRTRERCLASGLPTGSMALSRCELDARPAATLQPILTVAPLEPATSRGLDLTGREKLACAEIGFDPVSAAFEQCVADLDAKLFVAQRPSR